VQVDVATTPVPDVYRLLTSLVVPRPIAWVTTVDAQGRANLAPFSFFNCFGANPPVVVFSPTLNRRSEKKDTLRNIEATGEFVIHPAVADLAEQVNQSSKELPAGESEIDLVGLRTTPASKVKPPRLVEAPASLECVLQQIIPVGNGPISGNLVIGTVVQIHVDDRILGSDGTADPRKLRAIARLGGEWYCHSTDLFALARPS
jgi:flavin reductase (DIM6/NTAB) family NADH-FMN oxidoreductase RutF